MFERLWSDDYLLYCSVWCIMKTDIICHMVSHVDGLNKTATTEWRLRNHTGFGVGPAHIINGQNI